MARPIKVEGRDTRRDILTAALDLFAQDGFFGTSMRQIARAVGVRESALYHHFASKDAILVALVQELGPGRASELAEIDLDEALRAGGEAFLKEVTGRIVEIWSTPEEQKFARLMLAEGPRLGAGGVLHPLTVIGRAQKLLSQLFAELMRRGVVKKLEPDVVALEFIGPLLAIRMMHLVLAPGPPDRRALRTLVAQHVGFFWGAVKP